MRGLKEYYGKLSLQNKLRLSYILLILIPVTLLCVGYYWAASQSILSIAKKNVLDVTVKNMNIIDEQLETVQAGSIHLNVDRDIFEVLQHLDEAKESDLLVWDTKIRTVLQKYISNKYVLSATIMTPRFIFGDNTMVIIPSREFFASGLYEKIKGKKGEAQWIPTYEVERAFNLDFKVVENSVFSMAQVLNPVLINQERPNNVEYLTNDTEAVFIIHFDEEMIRNLFAESNSAEGSFYCVSTPDGTIISHSQKDKNGTVETLPWLSEIGGKKEGSVVLPYQKERVVVCYSVSAVTGWIAASVVPVNSLLNNVSRIQMLTILVWILLFILAMILAAVFSRRITKPVESLVNAMKQTGTGNFSLRLPVQGEDEMQYLTSKYNEMGDRIQTLIEENYESEIRKKEAEIMALNLQMNPHFLYNTLNIINMMAMEEGNDEVCKMLISLSDMLQYTFRNRQELVVFEEEYLWLQNYLHIMGVRFEGKFTVQYEVDKTIYKYKVPKLLIQPLVENAIVHGFSQMEQGGLLKIIARESDDRVYLEIWDNGKGMVKEALEKAMNGDYNRIGLSNAVRRLQLIYGEKGRLEVVSAVGEGTGIMVSFPCQE